MIADRTKKVREARDEAKKELEAYKSQKEVEFKKFESEVRATTVQGHPADYSLTRQLY